jgi:hypothetical protein
MAELTTRDGMPPPADLPDGELLCTRLDDGTIRIDRADPRILISGELLDSVPLAADSFGATPDGPALMLEHHAWLDTAGCTDGSGYAGAVLHIDGVNRTVIYRITEYVPRVHGYIGEWPD